MEEDLYAAAMAFTAITDLVAARISWSLRPPSDPLPALVFHKVSAPVDYTLASRVGLVGYLVQIDAWGSTFGEAVDLARAVQALLDSLTAPPWQGAFIENVRSDAFPGDAPQGSAPSNLFRQSTDARIWHQPAA